MGNKMLWNQFEGWKNDYKWVDLTRELSPETPHWSGFPDMVLEVPFDYPDGFFVHKYTLVSQYGTHIDAPCHFPQGRRSLDQIMPDEMVLPLCVIDVSEKVKANVDYTFCVQDVLDWEAVYGKIPEGCFVAMRTDWGKRDELDNVDENGNASGPYLVQFHSGETVLLLTTRGKIYTKVGDEKAHNWSETSPRPIFPDWAGWPGAEMESAPHPQQVLFIDLGQPLEKYDILRRKED